VKLLELMAAGCAVIASRTGDVPAVAGNAAVLVDDPLPEAFATATVDLLSNPNAISRLSSAARERAVAQFSIRALVDQLESFYRSTGALTT
jgi:glycosyltransferase involved in cell wall biosynthesis